MPTGMPVPMTQTSADKPFHGGMMYPTATDYAGLTHKIEVAHRDIRTGMHEVKTACGMEVLLSGVLVDLTGWSFPLIDCEICQERL